MNTINQCLLITITSIVLIILLLVYSYNKKFNPSVLEMFTTTTTTVSSTTTVPTTTTTLPELNNELIGTINEMKNPIQKINDAKKLIYPIYNSNKLNKYSDQKEFEISKKNFKFEEGKFALNFYQQLQDREIEDLDSKYKDVKQQLDNLGLIKNDKTYNYIKHNISGIKLRILNYNDKNANSNFNIMYNNDTSMCLEYTAIHPDVVKATPLHKTINNINSVPCDRAVNMSNLSETVKSRILQQKFKFKIINNNDDYNNSLHINYNAFKVPDYYQLNNYPYVLIYPDNNTEYDDNYVLTIYNGQMSVEPCSGADNQKFTLLTE